MKYSIAKGVFDILPEDHSSDGLWRSSYIWQFVEEKIREITKAYGFKEIRTPIFEHTELFVRGVGDSSDIVTKEMYTFIDKGERSLTLRPEGTAAVIRAFVEKHLDQRPGPHKYYYIGPMFRYERPQAGRFRQHHQFGVEAIGNPQPEQDVEVIDLLCEFYRRLGLKNLTVMLNSVGDSATRDTYRTALRDFLRPKLHQLSEDSQMRFEKNVLRILDSKDPGDRKILETAPVILDVLSEESRTHFERVKSLLSALGIKYEINPHLVRGLDYYTKTVFEVTSGSLGAQNAIGAGGRFDGLTELLGGPNLPSVGFATGFERVIQSMIAQNIPLPTPPHPIIFIIPIGEEAKDYSVKLLFEMRHQNIPAEMDFQGKKIGTALQLADALKSTYALVIGENELKTKQVKLKKLATREEIQLSLNDLFSFLEKNKLS